MSLRFGLKFVAKIRFWDPAKSSGLAVVDIPRKLVESLEGLKQMKVKGKINGAEYESNVMPAGGGRLALSVSQKTLEAGNTAVGKTAEFEIERRDKRFEDLQYRAGSRNSKRVAHGFSR